MFSKRALAFVGAALFTFGACSGSATTAPSESAAAPSESAAAPSASSAAPSESASAPSESAAAPSVVASVPADLLVTADKLTVCSDIPYPPQELFDASGNPTGSDIDIAGAIASRLGLSLAVNNTVFDTIIAALQGNKCDIIVSAQNITSDRIKKVDMIPYFNAGQSFVVTKGNPKGLNTTMDLCGKTIGAETGTTEADYLVGTGDYKGNGLTQACAKAGKPAINAKQYEKDSDALLALQAGAADAYFADSPVAGYYAVQHADQFELSPIPPLQAALEGISVQNDAPHKPLEQAVQQALVSMINDGTYLSILKKWGDDSGAIDAATAGQINKIGK